MTTLSRFNLTVENLINDLMMSCHRVKHFHFRLYGNCRHTHPQINTHKYKTTCFLTTFDCCITPPFDFKTCTFLHIF